MFRKRRRKSTQTDGAQQPGQAPASPSPSQGSSPTPHGPRHESKPRTPVPDALKEAMEKATERTKSDLAAKGKMEPVAFFVEPDGGIKRVALTVRNGPHKEVVALRIKEKAIAENALAVMVLTEMDNARHSVVLSAVTPGAKASLRIDYRYDAASKTVTSWKVSWLSHPVQNMFVDGVFPKAG